MPRGRGMQTLSRAKGRGKGRTGLDIASWPAEFARVVNCSRCTTLTGRNLLRDALENIPQPGFIGANFERKRVLLVGPNPAITKSAQSLAADQPYTAMLRQLRDAPTEANFRLLLTVTRDFMPTWRVHQDYFPLRECGLELDDLAYMNVVRCRTARVNRSTGKLDDTPPNRRVVEMCVAEHFARWVDLLNPRIILFIGKYARDYGSAVALERQIPFDYLNRERSRTSELRASDLDRVARLLRRIVN